MDIPLSRNLEREIPMSTKTGFRVLATLALLLILPGNLQGRQAVQPGRQITWQITAARVVNPGATASGAQGTVTNGYEIEAEAGSEGAAPIPKGTFRLTLSIFSPGQDQPGQKAGLWYLRGSWSLADKNLPPQAAKARHSRGVIKGELTGELPFNPALSSGSVHAQVRMPMSPQAGGWGKGRGAFKGNEKFEGQLDLVLERWQKTSKPQGGTK
jgi:hypothetical protein